MKKSIILTLLFALSVSFVGCSGRSITTSSIPEKPIDTRLGRSIIGEACGFQLLLFIPIMVNSRQERAYNDLVEASRGEHIADVKINETWTYGFVGTGYCTQIRATAFPYKK